MNDAAPEGTPHLDQLVLAALTTVAYEWAAHPDSFELRDEFDALEALQSETCQYSTANLPLADLYPRIVRLAALALVTIAALPQPHEIDGLVGFEGLVDDGSSP